MATCGTDQNQKKYEDNAEHEDIKKYEDHKEFAMNKEIVDPDSEVVKKIDEYLFSLYENELKFKRPEAEVEYIISAVKNIVEMLMAAVKEIDLTYEIYKQYLVGSMAEGTSIMEPNEFDFLVTFSNQSEDLKEEFPGLCSVTKSGKPLKFNGFSTVLRRVLSSLNFQLENSEYGKLSINSKIVCCHGPASVIKLLWKPLSETSTPLDILVDITPCIELQGIDKVIQASDVAIPAHYEALVKDDRHMLVLETNKYIFEYAPTFTMTEVKLVRNLSEPHKLCYLILKYCLNCCLPVDLEYKLVFSSYIIKSFVLRHAARCRSITTGNTDMRISIYPCLVDILRDLQNNVHENTIDGIFGTLDKLFYQFPKNQIHHHIENTIQMLVQIGKQGNTPSNRLKFKNICQRDSIHLYVQVRDEQLHLDGIKCHLSHKCGIHHKHNCYTLPSILKNTSSVNNLHKHF